MTKEQRVVNELIPVIGGTFVMGNRLTPAEILRLPRKRQLAHAPSASRADVQASARLFLPTVSVDSFWISQYPVTQQEWEQVMQANPSHFRDPQRPVECITWPEAVAYCNQRSRAERLSPCYEVVGNLYICHFQANGYRLPTEAEWEYAARGGQASQHFVFPGSNNVDLVAWHGRNAGGQTHRVGEKAPNELGLYDLAGNVYELCWDWHEPHHRPDPVNPTGPSITPRTRRRVARGGCYANSPHLLYTGRRLGRAMDEWNDHLGFRVVRQHIP